MRQRSFALRGCLAAVVAVALAPPAAAQEAPYCPIDINGRVASVFYQGSTVYFEPLVEYERLVLTVATPCSTVVREFGHAENPWFDVRNVVGAVDGTYTWELRVTPVIDPAVKRALEKSRDGGDPLTLIRLQQEGLLPDGPMVDSAVFTVVDGRILPPEENERSGNRAVAGVAAPMTPVPGGRRVTAADQVIPDDLIVQGSACVGFDCVNNENFSYDTIRLKENNLRIHFDDTSTQAGYPANDWRIIANSSASGGASKFCIEDSTGAKTPFTITAGAATNSLFVDSGGRVGFRTSTPVLDLHVNSPNTPALRLEQNSSGGFTAQTWDIGANEANFFVRDVTGGSKLSLRIRPGAPTSSLDISADGDVGIGTASPDAKLEVVSDAVSAATVRYTNTNASGFAGAEYFENATQGLFVGLDNANNTARINAVGNYPLLIMTNSTERLRFPAPGGDFIDVAGNTAALNNIGQWVDASSRDLKQDITSLSSTQARDTLKGLNPVTFAYKAAPGEVQAGFIAEDVPELVAEKTRTRLSALELVAVLTKVVQDQQSTIDQLAARLAEIERQRAAD
jgi:hypothetical protein